MINRQFTHRLRTAFRSRRRRVPTHQDRNDPETTVPYIRPDEYGIIPIKTEWLYPKITSIRNVERGIIYGTEPSRGDLRVKGIQGGPWLTFADLNTHNLVVGGTGTGKTQRWLYQINEGFYRATHFPPGPERDHLKFTGFILDPKAGFPVTNFKLAKKYGRLKDYILFGPRHKTRYNPFGNPDETAAQFAYKLYQMMVALDDGQTGSEPFWRKGCDKLMTNIHILHRFLHTHVPEKVAAMTFPLLNLLVMDKGVPRNEQQLLEYRQSISDRDKEVRSQLQVITQRLATLIPQLEDLAARTKKETAEVAALLKWLSTHHQALGNREPASLTPVEKKQFAELDAELREKEQLKDDLANISALLEGVIFPAEAPEVQEREQDYQPYIKARLIQQLEAFQETARRFDTSPLDTLADRAFTLLTIGFQLSQAARESIGPLNRKLLGEDTHRSLRDWIEQQANLDHVLNLLIGTRKKKVEPERGKLLEWLELYSEILKAQGKSAPEDPVYCYLKDEHFSVPNREVAGTVSMFGSALCNLFVHQPFCDILTDEADFDFRTVIDEGKIVAIDCHDSVDGVVAKILQMLLKCDWMSVCLSRDKAWVYDKVTKQKRLINQDRYLLYLTDESHKILTAGGSTGEANLLDRVRAYLCCYVMATQSYAMIRMVLPETEFNALLTNVTMRGFFTSKDPATVEQAVALFPDVPSSTVNYSQSPEESIFSQDANSGPGYSFSDGRRPKFSDNDFKAMPPGVMIIDLPTRFGREGNGFRTKISFHRITDPYPDIPFPAPIIASGDSGNSQSGRRFVWRTAHSWLSVGILSAFLLSAASFWFTFCVPANTVLAKTIALPMHIAFGFIHDTSGAALATLAFFGAAVGATIVGVRQQIKKFTTKSEITPES